MPKLPIKLLKPNPNNPRLIKDDKYKKLVQSLKDFPEMAEVREIVVNKDHLILGGNMRYKAMIEAGWTEAPVKIVDWSLEKQKEFIIKDNVSGGEWDWDVLANEWDQDQLKEWSVNPVPWQDGYKPNEDPSFDDSPTTKAEIEKRAKELANQMVKQRSTIDAICPECGEEFKLQP